MTDLDFTDLDQEPELQLDTLEEPAVEDAHPTTDIDLDDLLQEAVVIADARKAVRRSAGGKRQIDPALADIAQAAEAALVWVAEYAVARFIERHCSCGASHREFDGWFIVSSHRRDPYARRYVRSPDHHELPAWQYTAVEEVGYCAECVSEFALPVATIDHLTGIDALGQPAGCCCPDECQHPLELDDPLEGDTEKALWEEIENAV